MGNHSAYSDKKVRQMEMKQYFKPPPPPPKRKKKKTKFIINNKKKKKKKRKKKKFSNPPPPPQKGTKLKLNLSDITKTLRNILCDIDCVIYSGKARLA